AHSGATTGSQYLVGISSPDLSYWHAAEDQSCRDRDEECEQIEFAVWLHKELKRKVGYRSPSTDDPQQHGRYGQSYVSAASCDYDGLNHDWAQNSSPAGTECHADREFAGTICRARCKQSAKIGACRKENEDREQHDSEHESAHRSSKHVPKKSG